MYLPPICRISQKRLNNATPCVTAARRPLLLVNAYTPRPVGLLHDAFHRGQSAVLLTVSAQNLFRLRLWNKAHWGGCLAGVRAHPKTMSHCDSTETGLTPYTACITTLFISHDMVDSKVLALDTGGAQGILQFASEPQVYPCGLQEREQIPWDDSPFSPNSGTTFPPICDIFAICGNMYNIFSILSNIFPIFV